LQETQRKKKNIFLRLTVDLIILLMWVIFIAKYNNWFEQNIVLYQIIKYINLLTITITTMLVYFSLVLYRKNYFVPLWMIIKFYFRLLFFIPIVIKYLYKFFRKIVSYVNKILHLPKRIEVKIVVFIFSIIAIRNIFFYNNEKILFSSMIILGLGLFVTLFTMFNWTSNPKVAIDIISKLIEKGWEWINKFFEKIGIYKKKKDGDNQSSIYLFKTFYTLFHILEIKVGDLYTEKDMKIYLIKKFIWIFVLSIIITVFIFSFEYYSMFKIDNNSILISGSTYWDFLYFSTLSLINMDFGQVVLNGLLIKIISIIQVFTTLFYLTFIILMFSSLSEQAATEKILEFKDKMKNIKNDIGIKAYKNFQIEFDVDNNKLIELDFNPFENDDIDNVIDVKYAASEEEDLLE